MCDKQTCNCKQFKASQDRLRANKYILTVPSLFGFQNEVLQHPETLSIFDILDQSSPMELLQKFKVRQRQGV